MQDDFASLVRAQQLFFTSDTTRCIHFRIRQLRILKKLLITHTTPLLEALHTDLGKSTFEAYATELYPLLQNIDLAISKLPTWTQRRTIHTPLLLQPACSYQLPEPYGYVLIIAPWNYPLHLTLLPLIGAIAAGNCALIKPSEHAPHTSAALASILNTHFDTGFIQVIQGDKDATQLLLKHHFDYLFFTGSAHTGKIVMHAAAEHITPLTLELGGKCPTIVHADASIDCAAKRIAWGKFLNAGQSCVAPDYVAVHVSVHKEFIDRLHYWINQFYGPNAATSQSYARIINETQFERLSKLLHAAPILVGGETNREMLYIEPTVLKSDSFDGPLMQEEIFGPLLPIMSYEDVDMVLTQINRMPKPLALYLFTHNEGLINRVTQTISAGTLGINDVVLPTASPYLPFGGVGTSGFGQYHGKASFDTFSHYKSILRKNCWFDNLLRYPPYTKVHALFMRYLQWLRR